MNRRQLISKLFTGSLASLFGAKAFGYLKEKEMIPNVVVSMPSQLFTLARKFQAASNGKIFIGKIDTDPTLTENQIQVYLENEDGSHIPVPQPLIINQAGFPVYNGQIAKFVTAEGHSMAVYDSYGVQQHYYSNVLKYDPDQFKDRLLHGDGAYNIGYGSSTVGDYLDVKSEGKLITDLVTDLNKNNRNEIYNHGGNVFIPKNITVRCNLLPNDDISIFKGEGKILTRDPWGNEHVFDISLANRGSEFTGTQLMHQNIFNNELLSIGVLGDSISDGAWSYEWKANPTDSNGNLSSRNYDHNINGGKNAWPSHFVYLINKIKSRVGDGFNIKLCNASSSGKKLSDGWAYRNFDYGFFQNEAYKNKAPNVLILSMGVNDEITDFKTYLKCWDKLIRKAWGYGCSVIVTCVGRESQFQQSKEYSVKSGLHNEYKNLEYFDLSLGLMNISQNSSGNMDIFWGKSDGSIDTTHPQSIAHAVIAGELIKNIFGNSFVSVISHDCGISPQNTNLVWSCQGYPSNKFYKFSVDKIPAVNISKIMSHGVSAMVDSENVTLDTIVYCEDEFHLLITEPFISRDNFTSTSRRHSISVEAYFGKSIPNDEKYNKNRIIINGGAIASSFYEEGSSYTTYVCKLKKGINKISIVYDGMPSKVWAPMLFFRKNVGVNIPISSEYRNNGTLTHIVNYSDLIGDDVYTGQRNSIMPDSFSKPLSSLTNISVDNIPKNNSLLIFCDKDMDKFAKIENKNGVLYFNDGVVEQLIGDHNRGVSISAYNNNGKNILYFRSHNYKRIDTSVSGGGFGWENKSSSPIINEITISSFI